MKSCLLIGNGLNRCLENSIAWSDLLKETAEKYKVSYNGHISLPLEFESIVNEYQRNNGTLTDAIYAAIKHEIADKLLKTKLPNDAIHKRLSCLNVGSIMTTNYDYLLENVFDSTYKYQGDKSKKYLFDSISTLKGISFYHLHGLTEIPQSICLGYEHYMGIVEKLRTEINTKENNRREAMRIKQVLFGEKTPTSHWGEKFYTDNIGIVGLGLTECEVDLWWLITHRAFLYYSNYENIRSVMKNSITYFDILDYRECENEEGDKARKARLIAQQARHKLLENEHVIVKTYNLGKGKYRNFEEAYTAIFEYIQKEGLEQEPAKLQIRY